MAQWLYRIVPTRPEMVAEPTDDEVAVDLRALPVPARPEGPRRPHPRRRTQETEGTFGITIFEAPDEDAARAIMEADPAVAGGVMAATLHPYAVAVARDGLEPRLRARRLSRRMSGSSSDSRTCRRSTLPISDFGSSSTTKMRRGTL